MYSHEAEIEYYVLYGVYDGYIVRQGYRDGRGEQYWKSEGFQIVSYHNTYEEARDACEAEQSAA